MEISITKEAKKIIKDIVKVYNARIKDGISKRQAVQFAETDSDHEMYDEDVLWELNKAGLINLDITDSFDLEPNGISYSEELTTQKVLTAVDIASNLIP